MHRYQEASIVWPDISDKEEYYFAFKPSIVFDGGTPPPLRSVLPDSGGVLFIALAWKDPTRHSTDYTCI